MIKAERLTKYYGSKLAIEDVSFDISRGEIVGLLGPNGAGKTTVLRILTCFMPPTRGKALINGLDTTVQSLEARRNIGFLPENVPLYQELPVERFLRFAAQAKGIRRGEADAAINKVIGLCGLEDHRQRLIKHLSKGLRQRVGLAQALIGDPPILILDEPTTGLDPAQIIEIRQLISELGKERTVLLSTHILPEVSQVCSRVIIMNKGNIIAQDTQEGLKARVRGGKQTVLRIGARLERIREVLEPIPGVKSVQKGEREGDVIVESRDGEDLRPLLAKALVEAGIPLWEMRPADITLEEVFVHLVTEDPARLKGD